MPLRALYLVRVRFVCLEAKSLGAVDSQSDISTLASGEYHLRVSPCNTLRTGRTQNADSDCSLLSLFPVMQKKGSFTVSMQSIQADGPMGFTPSLGSIAKQTSLSNSHSQIIIEESRTNSWTEERMVRGGHVIRLTEPRWVSTETELRLKCWIRNVLRIWREPTNHQTRSRWVDCRRCAKLEGGDQDIPASEQSLRCYHIDPHINKQRDRERNKDTKRT